MREQEQANKWRMVAYAIGGALILVGLLWRLF